LVKLGQPLNFLWKTTCQQVSTGNSLHTPKISTGEIFTLVRYPQDKSWLSCVNRGFFTGFDCLAYFEIGCALEDIDLNDVWTRTLESLSAGALTPQQRAFVTLTRPLGIVGDTALVAAPNEFTKDVLESRLSPIVCDALSATLGREMRLAVTVDESIAPYLDDEATDDLADSTYADIEKVGLQSDPNPALPPQASRGPAPAPRTSEEGSRLNPKYTFDTFVPGSSNRFAHRCGPSCCRATG